MVPSDDQMAIKVSEDEGYNVSDAVDIQRAYYAKTAVRYDEIHVAGDQKDGHFLALSLMAGLMQHYGCQSVLDVGAGTGRTILWLRQSGHSGKTVGVEPVSELRERGFSKGLHASDLVDGDATRLAFDDREFDVVCSFGMLHHLRHPDLAVREMLRVSRRMIFISDANNFGQGSRNIRWLKQIANAVGLWPTLDYIKTRGRRYTITEGDGLAYSYSVFTNYPSIRAACSIVHLFNTTDSTSINLYRGASQVVLAGVKSC